MRAIRFYQVPGPEEKVYTSSLYVLKSDLMNKTHPLQRSVLKLYGPVKPIRKFIAVFLKVGISLGNPLGKHGLSTGR